MIFEDGDKNTTLSVEVAYGDIQYREGWLESSLVLLIRTTAKDITSPRFSIVCEKIMKNWRFSLFYGYFLR